MNFLTRKEGELPASIYEDYPQLQETADNLRRRRAAVERLVGSPTILEKLLGSMARKLPEGVINIVSPAAKFRASLRDSTIATHERRRELTEEGSRLIERYEEIEELLRRVEEDPNDQELLDLLGNKLSAPVEAELGLPKDEETDIIIASLIAKYAKDQQQTRRQQVIEDAGIFLDHARPTIQTLVVQIITTDNVFNITRRRLSLHQELGGSLDALDRAVDDNNRAAQLGIVAPRVIISELERALAGAKNSIALVRAAEEEARKPVRLEELEGLEEKFNQLALPPADPKK